MDKYAFNPEDYKKELKAIFYELLKHEDITPKVLEKELKRFPKDGNKLFRKDQLVSGLEWLEQNDAAFSKKVRGYLSWLKDGIKMKPMRTESGVTTVTVLTKPFACPGKCIFCPNDVRMPKSYIATEPGAQRALMNRFDPYLQVTNRLQALKNIGHPTEKIELLVLGGTWSSYPESYQVWFVKEMFRAMNDFQNSPSIPLFGKEGKDNEVGKGSSVPLTPTELKSYLKSDYNNKLRKQVGDLSYNRLIATKEFKHDFNSFIVEENIDLKDRDKLWVELEKLQEINSHALTRCVGLVLETRPDAITEREVLRLRHLGATKIQLGVQTLDDVVNELNKRGETREDSAKAFRLLRAGGFKIHVHMMPNLYGATPAIDREVYKDLFSMPEFKPDEVKIYPTSTIKFTELHELYKEGKYKPYAAHELIDLIADLMEMTPEYCRLTRIIRDIPSTEIEAGNKTTNLREVVERKLLKEHRKNPNIRDREIGNKKVGIEDLDLDIIKFDTTATTEYFLQYITKQREIAGFLRLSVPRADAGIVANVITSELDDCAMIREVHVYGPSLELSKDSIGEAQHLGLGTKLIEKAKEIVSENGFKKLAVISAIGTREYYEKRGFKLEKLYQIAEI